MCSSEIQFGARYHGFVKLPTMTAMQPTTLRRLKGEPVQKGPILFHSCRHDGTGEMGFQHGSFHLVMQVASMLKPCKNPENLPRRTPDAMLCRLLHRFPLRGTCILLTVPSFFHLKKEAKLVCKSQAHRCHFYGGFRKTPAGFHKRNSGC